jgi:NRPS condensation-like uncharacterized protein
MDRANEPMIIHAMLCLEGEVDSDRLGSAVARAQEIYPVMGTLIRSNGLRTFREIQDGSRDGVLTVQDLSGDGEVDHNSQLFDWMNQPMDPREVSPLRVLLLRRNGRESLLVFSFHHSSTDGVRATLFVKSVVELYNNGTAQTSPGSQEIRVTRKSDELLEFANSQRSRVGGYYLKMASALFKRFVIDAMAPPTRVYHDRTGSSKRLHYCFETISTEELESIESKARAVDVMLNDIILAACYRTVEKWNHEHGKRSGRVFIMAPVNMRPKGYRNVVSNQAAWISPSTSPRDRQDPARLLQKVNADTREAAKNRTAFSLIYYFYLCSQFPLSIMRLVCRFLIVSRIYVNSIIVTNVGVIWPKPNSEEAAFTNLGDARIVNFTGSAPVVTPMGLCVCVNLYNRKMNVSLTYRNALFSDEKAQEFLHMLVDEIRDYQAEPEAA